MQKIFRKRVLRDLKSNCFRYLALGLMIVLGMYLVVSLVGAADTVISDVNSMSLKNHLEDGEFSVFVPLTGKQEGKLKNKGITLEKMFYLDYILKDNSTVRVFKSRKKINLIVIDKGRTAKNSKEAVIEKRYSEEHNLSVGDNIAIDGDKLKIVGIGTVPDYDSMLKNMSDSNVDSKHFGLAFVTDKKYENLKENGNYSKTEEYVYGYKLNGKMTNSKLKNYLNKLKLDTKKVRDPYFQEFLNKSTGKKKDIKNGIGKLSTGATRLKKSLSILKKNNITVQAGADRIFKTYLDETYNELEKYGYNQKLTEKNYKAVLQSCIDNTDKADFKIKLGLTLKELDALEKYKHGIDDYTGGVARSSGGAASLTRGMQKLKKNTNKLLNKYFKVNINDLTQFVTAADNPRIKASAGDQIINKYAGLVSGIIVMILFTYVISVFVIHGIEKESSTIGALYALGVKKKELVMHYLTLPIVITLLAGACGTVLGFSKYGVNVQLKDCYTYYSVPKLEAFYPFYLIIYGVIMPPVIAVIVNYFVISKKLSQPALKLIRNEQKNSRISNINLGNMGFVRRFQIRQMLREARTGFTVIFGMFISLLVMMIGIDCYVMCHNISVKNKADTKYEYMYTYKYPQKKVPTSGEGCYAETLSKKSHGYNLDITLLGIDNNNPYFNVNTVKGKNKVVVASSTAEKFKLKKGDKLILEDRANNMDYAFTIAGIAPYSVGLHAFMDIDSMRELFGQKKDYYNVVLSSQKLNIAAGRLYTVTTKKDISKSSDVFIDKMIPMISMLIVVSSIIFCVVMYLMMKVMIDRSAFNISLIKIFGYKAAEVRKLYLNGNFYIILVGAIISIPLAKKLMDTIYPYFVSNVACGIDLRFSGQLYLGIFAGVMLLYFVINQLLVGRLKKLSPAEVLKNRE
ncbi:FtsX-like permease family protein [Clostridium oryzae]|uniref:FtsX-like permease family protein n=1 Tax=Clostridium oryzae TaxID=1450648 RepID=A0A1V4II12_9CLOT|nr:FtsX-like permease family protein [Clostridium oryzae]OPJ59566.1 FtsX-like permease family protein [Clostridium oryzae]